MSGGRSQVGRRAWILRNGEVFAVGLIAVGSLLIQLALLPSEFKGPDARTFLRLAELAQTAEYWRDPEAFDGNYWSVGYTAFLAAARTFLGTSVLGVQILQVVMSATLVLLTWLLCRGERRAVRLTAAVVAALSPSLFFVGSNGGYEVLLSWLVVVSIAVAWGVGGSPEGAVWWRKWGAGLVSGLMLGLAFIVQNKAVVLVPVVLFMMWRWGRPGVLAWVGALLVPIGAWSLRNLVVRNSPSPLNTNGEINLWIGSNPDVTTGGFMEPPPLPSGTESYLQATLDFWVSQPELSIALLMRRGARLLEPTFIYPEVALPPGGTLILHSLAFAFSAALLLLACAFLFGRLWVVPPDLPAVGSLALAWLVFLLVHLPFLAEPRFRTPMEPVLIAVAVPTAFSLSAKLSRRGTMTRTTSVASGAE